MKRRVITAAGVLLTLIFLTKALGESAGKISSFSISSISLLSISVALLSSSTFLRALVWRRIVTLLEPESRLPLSSSIKIFMYSWISRYIPGRVAPILSKVHFGYKDEPSQKTLLMSGVLETIIPLTSGILLSLLFLPFLGSENLLSNTLVVILFSVVSLFFTFFIDSKLFYKILNIILERIGREPVTERAGLSHPQTFLFIIGFGVIQLLRGVAFFFFVASISPIGIGLMPQMIGLFIVATMAGVITLLMPGGIGVVEGVLFIGLQSFIPQSIALKIAVMSRVWDMTTDVLTVGVVSGKHTYYKLSRKIYER